VTRVGSEQMIVFERADISRLGPRRHRSNLFKIPERNSWREFADTARGEREKTIYCIITVQFCGCLYIRECVSVSLVHLFSFDESSQIVCNINQLRAYLFQNLRSVIRHVVDTAIAPKPPFLFGVTGACLSIHAP
jgi:hypothetical protein